MCETGERGCYCLFCSIIKYCVFLSLFVYTLNALYFCIYCEDVNAFFNRVSPVPLRVEYLIMNLNVTAALIATVGAAWPSPPCIKGAAAHLKARRGLSGNQSTTAVRS